MDDAGTASDCSTNQHAKSSGAACGAACGAATDERLQACNPTNVNPNPNPIPSQEHVGIGGRLDPAVGEQPPLLGPTTVTIAKPEGAALLLHVVETGVAAGPPRRGADDAAGLAAVDGRGVRGFGRGDLVESKALPSADES